jgi:meso-butanediol dehydrogenase / (S,S)-butanediol dehydrogenase / diacetyl reductase
MKLALVTGGAKGIGRSIASKLLDDRMDVAVLDCAERSGLDPRVRFFKGDVTREEDLRDLAAKLLLLGGVDVLVNNAGIRGPTAPVSSYPLKDWEAVLKLNLTGAFLCCQLLTTAMQEKRWGRIINISSMAGKTPYPLRSGYAASKWGLVGLTLTLAGELGSHGITVNAVCPGPVENENMRLVMQERAAATGQSFQQIRDEFIRQLAVPQLPQEADVAAMVSYLASDAAWCITGQALEVSSGYRA